MKDNKEIIIGALRAAKTEKDVEKIFYDYKKESFKDKICCLEEAMYSPKIFFSSGEVNDDEKKYKILLDAFIVGKWRLYEQYIKLGLNK